MADYIYADDFPGENDDDRFDAAIAYARAQRVPPWIASRRALTLSRSHEMFSGMKLGNPRKEGKTHD